MENGKSWQVGRISGEQFQAASRSQDYSHRKVDSVQQYGRITATPERPER